VSGPGAPRRVAYLYILPTFIFYVGCVLLPVSATLGISFLTWDGLTPAHWNGLGNYLDLLHDERALTALRNALVFIVYYSILPVAAGLLLAGVMARAPIRGLTFFRTALFIPQILSGVVIGLIWIWVYSINGGPVNAFLGLIGLGYLRDAWLGSFSWALHAVGFIGFWVDFGFCMVLFLAGVQKIPTELYDAARVDGADRFHEFVAITAPALRYEIAVALVLTIITAMRNFDTIWNSSQGGPGITSIVPSIEVYNRALLTGQVGSASALAIVVALITLVLTVGVLRVFETES
jgi:raffinose/stachyose/melibiose transport system permease protein